MNLRKTLMLKSGGKLEKKLGGWRDRNRVTTMVMTGRTNGWLDKWMEMDKRMDGGTIDS